MVMHPLFSTAVGLNLSRARGVFALSGMEEELAQHHNADAAIVRGASFLKEQRRCTRRIDP
jgi:hypothetical protein